MGLLWHNVMLPPPPCRWSWATAWSPRSTASSSARCSCPTRASTTAWPRRTASNAPSPRSACGCWARPWWACWRTSSSLRGPGPARCTPRPCWRPSVRPRVSPCSSTAKRGSSCRPSSSRSRSRSRLGLSGGTWPNWSPCWTGGRAATGAITSRRSENLTRANLHAVYPPPPPPPEPFLLFFFSNSHLISKLCELGSCYSP